MNKLKSLAAQLSNRFRRLGPYALPVFICLSVLVYGFLLLRITMLSQAQPSSQAVSSQVNTSRVLRVDPGVVDSLNSLQDNSVNVQSLFDQARENPFE
jgi:hypothetical protein